MIDNFVDLCGVYECFPNQTISAASVTGAYYPANKHNAFILSVGSLADTKVATLDILQATDTAGTGAKAISTLDSATSYATGTITGRARATELSILVTGVTNGKTVILTTPFAAGVTYTKAAATDTAAQEFVDAAGLLACINVSQSAYLVATSIDATHVKVRLINPQKGGYITESGVQETAKLITVTNSAQLLIEVAPDALDEANDFRYIAAKVTCDSTGICSVSYIREAAHRPDSGNNAYVVRVH